jgi:hypothetical protein
VKSENQISPAFFVKILIRPYLSQSSIAAAAAGGDFFDGFPDNFFNHRSGQLADFGMLGNGIGKRTAFTFYKGFTVLLTSFAAPPSSSNACKVLSNRTSRLSSAAEEFLFPIWRPTSYKTSFKAPGDKRFFRTSSSAHLCVCRGGMAGLDYCKSAADSGLL